MKENSNDKQRLLIVDDASENLHAMISILGDTYAVAATTSGEKALELAACTPQPELILLDIKMPGMDGYEVLRRLKVDPLTAGIPVIIITAMVESEDEAKGLKMGAADYIAKPVNPDWLKLCVLTQIELRRYRRKPIPLVESADVAPRGKFNILVVDDVPENIHQLISNISDEYRVTAVDNGSKALEIVLGPTPPDLVLLDILMPEMDGYETCRRIKATERGNHIPVIFLSKVGTSVEKVRGLSIGAADFLTKPFDIDEVRARLRTHLELSQLNRHLEQAVAQRTAALRKNENQLYEALYIARMGYWEYDYSTDVFLFNDQYYSLHNITAEEAGGYRMSSAEFASRYVHPEDEPLVGQNVQLAFESDDPDYFAIVETRILTGDGKIVWVEVRFKVEKDSQGRTIRLLGVNQDITERKQYEENIKHLNLVLNAIRNIDQLIIHQTDTEKLIREVCAFLVVSRGYNDAFIILLDEAGNPYTFADSGLSDIFPLLAEQLSQHILPHCLANTSSSDQIFIVADKSTGCVSCPIFTHGENSDTICCRLISEDRTYGFLVITTNPLENIFATEERTLLADMAGDLGFALNKIGLEKRRKDAENQVLSLSRFPSENPNPILRLDKDGCISYANQAAAPILNAWNVRSGETAPEKISARVRSALHTGHRDEIQIDVADRAFSCKFIPILGKEYVNIYGRDITEQRQAAAIIRESEIRYRRLFESAKDGILILDTETGMIVDVNPFMIDLLGYSRQSFLEKTIWELGIFDDIFTNKGNFSLLQKNEYIRYEDLPLETHDGQTIDVEFVSNVYQVDNRKVIQCNIRDISERKQAEKEIRFKNIILSTQQEATIDGILVVDENGVIISYNQRFVELWNIPSDLIETRSDESILKFVTDQMMNPDAFMHRVQSIYANRSEISHEEIVLKEDLIFDRYSAPMHDAGGAYFGRVWYFRDITERRATEMEIHEMNHQLEVKNWIAEICLTKPDKDMYADVMDVVLGELESPYGLFGYLDHESSLVCPSLTRQVWEECKMPEKNIIFPVESWKGLWGRALTEKKTQMSNELGKTPDGHIPIERVIATPVVQQGKVIGLMMVANKSEDYNDRDIQLLESIAGHLSPIVQARLSTAREEYQRIQAENKLKEYAADLENKVAARTQKLNDTLYDVEKSRDQIDGILKSVTDGLVVTDASNRVIQINRMAEEALGIRFEDVQNKPIQFAIEDASLSEKFTHTLNKQQPSYEFDFQVSDPETNAARIMRGRTSVVMRKDGLVNGVVTLIQDVTNEREVDRMKTEFISTAAHELRTPLTSILGFSEILLTRTNLEPKDKEKYLTYINKQAIGLASIINDLLDISRIESGKGFTLDKKECEVEDFVLPLIPHFQSLTEKHTFEVDLKDEDTKLLVDSEKMGQAVRNLLSNSVKYSPKGGLIRITGRKGEAAYEISVEDQGMGMTQDQVKRVFDKFYRADATSTAIEGTGLGMSIVKYIAEAHGGTASVQSEFGKGTTAQITIPLGQKRPD